MVFKFVAFAALVAVANAGVINTYAAAPLAYSAPIAKIATPVVAKAVVPEPYDANPQYNYGYSVQDGLTGDSKTQHEERNGDAVHGQYTVIDADGFRRVVDYTADPIHGFNAVVRREPLAVKAVAPVVAKVATPVAYAAPVAKVAHAYVAPIAKVAVPVAAYSTYASPAAVYHH